MRICLKRLTGCFNEKYEEIENERENQIQLQKEKAFLSGDIVSFMAKSVLAWDEIEDIGYLFFEENYLDKHKPSEKAIFGNGMPETKLYDLAVQMNRDGEDIRREIAIGLLGGQTSFTTNQDNTFQVEYGENSITATFGNAKREIFYEELGEAFYQLAKKEHDDIVHGRTMEDLHDILPNLNEETAEKLIQTFDGAKTADWKTDVQNQREIKSALYIILGDDEQTEKAFASIADMKYNFKEKEESPIHFGLLGNGLTVYDTSRKKRIHK